MLNFLKQKRILMVIAVVILVATGVAAYFVMRTSHQSPNSQEPSATSSSESGGGKKEDASQDAPEKKEEQKEQKSAGDKPANGGVSPQTNGGGQTTTGGSGGGTSPPQTVLYGWLLTAQNTGLAPHGLTCSSLPLYTGSAKPASGTVISQKRIDSTLDLSNGNITIEKSCIQPTSAGLGLPITTTTNYNVCNPDCVVAPSPVTIRDSEIDGTLLSQQESAYATGFLGVGSLYRNYIHGLGSGIAIANAGTSFSVTIEGNYVTGLTAYGDPGTTGNHSDAFTIRDFITTSNPSRQAIVKNNRFNCSSGNDTGAFFIQQTWGDNIDNVLVEGNLLEGQGYQLSLEGNTYGNRMYAINNRFSGTGFGAATKSGSGPGWQTWSSNFINNPGAANHQGVVVPKP